MHGYNKLFKENYINELADNRYIIDRLNVIEIPFVVKETLLSGFEIVLEIGSINSNNSLVVELIDIDDRTIVISTEIPIYKIRNGEWNNISFDPIENKAERRYVIRLFVDGLDVVYAYGDRNNVCVKLISLTLKESKESEKIKKKTKKDSQTNKSINFSGFGEKIATVSKGFMDKVKETQGKFTIKKNVKTEDKEEITREEVEKNISKFRVAPKITLITTTFNTNKSYLRQLLDSVVNQSYTNWSLIVVDGGSDKSYVKKILKDYEEKNENIQAIYLEMHMGISENINTAIRVADGDYVAFLYQDDFLSEHALYEIVDMINRDGAPDLLYCDDDMYDDKTKLYQQPNYKARFSIDKLRSINYIGIFSIIKRNVLNDMGGLDSRYDGCDNYDLYLKMAERGYRFSHVPKVIYHKRMGESSSFYSLEGGLRALREHLRRARLNGEAFTGEINNSFRIKYELEGEPLVSIVISSGNNIEDLKSCINIINRKTTYRNYEILVIENNFLDERSLEYYRVLQEHGIKVLEYNENFNHRSRRIVKEAEGDYIILLDDNMEVITDNWIEEMLQYAQRDDVGIVGAKVLNVDNTTQSAGIEEVYNISDDIIEMHKEQCSTRVNCVQNLSVVYLACSMIKRNVLDDITIRAYDDVPIVVSTDFCLNVERRGYLIVWNSFVEVYSLDDRTLLKK